MYLRLQRAYVCPLQFSHSSEGLRESCFVIFPKSCHKWSLTGTQKAWARTGRAGWRQKCYVPIGLGERTQKEVPPKAPSDGALALEKKINFSGDKQTSVSGMEGKFWQEGDKAWEDTMTGHRSLWTSVSSRGLPGFNSIPANQVDNFCNRKIFPKVCFHVFSLKFQMNLLLMGTISNAHLYYYHTCYMQQIFLINDSNDHNLHPYNYAYHD